MNNKYTSIILSLSIVILFSSCQHMQTRNNNQQLKKSRSVIYLEKAIKNHDKKISELTFQLKQVNENNNILTGEINKLIKKSSSQQQKMSITDVAKFVNATTAKSMVSGPIVSSVGHSGNSIFVVLLCQCTTLGR